jgi:hypothetical protein
MGVAMVGACGGHQPRAGLESALRVWRYICTSGARGWNMCLAPLVADHPPPGSSALGLLLPRSQAQYAVGGDAAGDEPARQGCVL